MLTGYILMQVECLAGCQPDPKLYSAGITRIPAPFPVKFTRRHKTASYVLSPCSA
jgi:hypothetical protein